MEAGFCNVVSQSLRHSASSLPDRDFGSPRHLRGIEKAAVVDMTAFIWNHGFGCLYSLFSPHASIGTTFMRVMPVQSPAMKHHDETHPEVEANAAAERLHNGRLRRKK